VSVPDPLAHVSRETQERLELLLSLLRKWTRRINLVAPGTLSDAWRRHVLDSAQLWHLRPKGAARWADLGSGGGFPGLVIAALAADEPDPVAVTLVEADQRKAAFLHTAASEMGLAVTVSAARIEAVPPLAADVVSARALAPLIRLIALAVPHGTPGTRYLFPKGRGAADELTETQRDWHMEIDIHRSVTADDGVILSIERPRRR